MELDAFNTLLVTWVIFVYGNICIISLIFTFSLEIYSKIDQELNLEIISTRIINPLDIYIDKFDAWMTQHNKIVGPLLFLLSVIDLKLLYNAIISL